MRSFNPEPSATMLRTINRVLVPTLPRGNAASAALRPSSGAEDAERPGEPFPRRAWERGQWERGKKRQRGTRIAGRAALQRIPTFQLWLKSCRSPADVVKAYRSRMLEGLRRMSHFRSITGPEFDARAGFDGGA